MPADLAINADGKAAMMYVGETPWHGLGTRLDNPATAAEAIVAAGLDWKVKKLKMNIAGTNIEVPGKMALARMNSDTSVHSILAVAGEGYVVIDNLESFDFFDTVVGAGQAIYHTAGALNGGRRVWILAKLPNNIVIKKNDEIEKFILLTTAHDATGALLMMHTPTRVVCQNTLTAALGNSTDRISIRHTKNAKSKVVLAREVLGISIEYYREFEKAANYLVSVSVDAQKFVDYLNKVFPIREDSTTVTKEHMETIRDQVTMLFDAKTNTLPGIEHTLWAAWNSVTEWSDHMKSIRGSDSENRLDSIWFGGAANLKQVAWDAALELAKV